MPGRRPVPELPLAERVKTFDEIQQSVRPQWAVAEARRCLLCEDAPCEKGCPAGVEIVKFIKAIRAQNFRKAIDIIRDRNIFAGVCARVCPQETLCEGRCSSTDLADPIAVGVLQRFCADTARRRPARPPAQAAAKGEKVAVIGAGPAGLTCALELWKRGYSVTLFEASEALGGLMRTAIPPYRLPRDVLDQEVELITGVGIEMRTGERIESAVGLLDDHAAVFLGPGSGPEFRAALPGEELEGVLSGLELLEIVGRALSTGEEPPGIGGRVAVIGGGNTAMDSARAALRLDAGQVTIFYRRTEEEMPAWKEEIEEARKEGVEIVFLAAPLKVLEREGRVGLLSLQRMQLGEPDESGRRRPVPVEGDTFDVEVETVVMALGQAGADLSALLPGIDVPRGAPVGPGEVFSPCPGVFAGGDAAGGPATVVEAVAAGRAGAEAIEKFLI